MSQSLRSMISGRAIALEQKLASSGEGTVWTTNVSGFLAKLYHHPTRERIEKLKVMIAHPPSNPMRQHHHVTFAWPQDLLISSQNQCLGFLMPEIVDGVKLSLIYNAKHRNRKAPRFNWYYLHTAALNFSLALKSLHEEGYVVGDIKPQNILVNSRALISIIDTDSFQVKDPLSPTIYRCLVGSEGFTPAELLGKELATLDQTEIHDRFRLGVLIYLLLFGDQPFKGKWIGRGESPLPADLIRQGFWPYAPNSMIQPGPNTIPLSIIHPQLQVCFQRCFTDGHSNPQARPSAEAWIDALKAAIVDLRMCHLENNHYFSRTYGRCYWCDRRSSLGLDVFSPTLTLPKPSTTPQRKTLEPKRPHRVAGMSRTIANSALASTPGSLKTASVLFHPSRTATQPQSIALDRLSNPILWGTGFILVGLLGLGFLLLPDLNLEAIRQGTQSLELSLEKLLHNLPARKAALKSKLNAIPASSAASSEFVPIQRHGGHWDTITSLDLSSDDQLLASGSKDMTVKLWSFPTGQLQDTFSDHYESVISVGISNTNQTLVTTSLGGKILAWDLKNRHSTPKMPTEEGWNVEGTIRGAVVDKQGQFVASSGWGGTILLQYLRSGKIVNIPSNSLASEQSLAILPNGKTIVSSSSDGKFQFWDTQTGALQRSFSRALNNGAIEPISAMTISKNGQFLASGGWYGSILIWDLQSGMLVQSLPKQAKPISAIALTDRADRIATVATDATIQIWNVKTGQRLNTLKGYTAPVSAIKFSHSGRFLVSGSEEPSIKVWDLSAHRVIATLVQ